jgi:hypothetical protein
LDQLSFFAKFVDVPKRVGAGLALAGLLLYLGQLAGIGFVIGLDPTLRQSVILAGLIGGCLLIADGMIAMYAFRAMSVAATAHRKLVSERLWALAPEHAATLKYLKHNGLTASPAQSDNLLLLQMVQLGFLQMHHAAGGISYYKVPDFIQKEIGEEFYKDIPVPEYQPWMFPPHLG